MEQIAPLDDQYIDEIIKSNLPYNPALNKTQGKKLRELIKLLRDRLEQELAEQALILEQKIDKIPGKGLSTSDFTPAEKEKLAGLTAGMALRVEATPPDENNAAFDQHFGQLPVGTCIVDLAKESQFIQLPAGKWIKIPIMVLPDELVIPNILAAEIRTFK